MIIVGRTGLPLLFFSPYSNVAFLAEVLNRRPAIFLFFKECRIHLETTVSSLGVNSLTTTKGVNHGDKEEGCKKEILQKEICEEKK
jgi:hypothetical protein